MIQKMVQYVISIKYETYHRNKKVNKKSFIRNIRFKQKNEINSVKTN